MATTFFEPGGDATQDISFYDSTVGTVIADNTHAYTGAYALKFATGASSNSLIRKHAILADAGRRISFRFYFDSLPAADSAQMCTVETAAGTGMFLIDVNTTGLMQIRPIGATTVIGTTVLAPNTWYQINCSYTITSSTIWKINLYINGVFEITANSSAAITTGSDRLRLGLGSTWGANRNAWIDDIYVDTLADYSYTGDIRVTAKRPVSNGTTNGFTTQIGAGGSGYGTGHSPQVNERPLSTTNGWSMIGAGAAVTEEYNIEARNVGDVNISISTITYDLLKEDGFNLLQETNGVILLENATQTTIIDYLGWAYMSSLASETVQMIVNGVNYPQAITSANTMYLKITGNGGYPMGTGTDIGITTDTSLTTVSLYECGVIVAYIPFGSATVVTNQRLNNLLLLGVT